MDNDVSPLYACNRGFGSALDATGQPAITIDWTAPRCCVVTVDDGILRWDMRLVRRPSRDC